MTSTLPKDARHLLHVMAVLADSETGEGWHGQDTIARMIGCTSRHVRSLLAFFEKPNDSGITIERRARFRSDGRGRTSDVWRLRSTRLPLDLLAHPSTNTVPAEQHSGGTPRTTNRNATTDQPEHRSGDLRSDLRSEQPKKRSRANARGSQRTLIDVGEPEQSEHQLTMACYSECYEAEHHEKPIIGSLEGKAVKELLAKAKGGEKAREFIRRAFQSFRRKTVTIQQIAKDPSSFHPEAPKRGQATTQHAPVDDPYFASLGKTTIETTGDEVQGAAP